MEHDTTLWTAPYHDEKYGEEKGASFKYFKAFIRCPTPRTLVHFHEVLSRDLSRNGRKKIPSYKTLSEYSSAWKWFMRAEAYDNYIHDVDDQKIKEKIRKIRNKNIDSIDDRLQYQNELFKQLKEDNELNTNQKVYGASKNSEAYRNEVASFNELVNEGKTKVDANLEADVKQEVSNEIKLKKMQELADRMENMTYD